MKRRIRRGIEADKQKYSGSSADALWRRLNSVDFLNQGMIFAGTLLLCAFPFLIVADALAGQSMARGLGRRLGLNRQAAGDVGHLFASSHATVTSVTGVAWVFLILSGYSVAASLQGLYHRIFGLDGRITRDMPRALIWLVALVAWLYVSGLAGPRVRAGGPAEFAVIFSGMLTSDHHEYGPIGTVFALMSYLVAIGVVVILGAVTGLVWEERGLSFRAALRKLRPNRGA